MTAQELIRHRTAGAFLRLGPVLTGFYAVAEWSPEAAAYVRRNGLDVAQILAHGGIFAIALCKFHGPAQDRKFSFDQHGEVSAVIEVLNADGCSTMDVLAWPVDAPWKFATAIGEADVLGAWQMISHGTQPLVVHQTPLAWLQSGCQGCVPLRRPGAGYWLRKAGGPYVAADADHGRELRDLLGAEAASHSILVRRSAGRVA